MKILNRMAILLLAMGLSGACANLFAHPSNPGEGPDEFIVTRHFTGTWDMVDHESQGLSLDVIEQADDSRRATVYWFTYGDDRKTAWYLGIGDLVEDRIDFELYDSTDVGFLQAASPGNESVQSIGTMSITFSGCDAGVVTYETTHDEVGSGTFNIERISAIMNTHCSGGISDDMHSDAMFGEQRMALEPARDGITGNGQARYEEYPGHMELKVEVEDLPDGEYRLVMGTQDRGNFNVYEGRGSIDFRSPAETGSVLMTFNPRGMQVEIYDDQGVVLSSFENRFEEDDRNQHGNGNGHHGGYGHNYDCDFGMGSGHGMGHGMVDCVSDGEFVEIEADLQNTGVLPAAEGEAEWRMNSDRVEFSVEIEDVPVGSYPLRVGGVEVGTIDAFEMRNGDVYGHIRFRDPETYGREHLDFEPRGEKIEVLQAGAVILEVEFPAE